MGGLFFKVIGCKVKTTVKIKNSLFAIFSYNYQLLLLHNCFSKVEIFHIVVPTFQSPHHRIQLPMLSANSLKFQFMFEFKFKFWKELYEFVILTRKKLIWLSIYILPIIQN